MIAPARPHTLFVLYTTIAGVLMFAVGVLRLRALNAPIKAGASREGIVTMYSLMILFGAALIVFALHWRFFA